MKQIKTFWLDFATWLTLVVGINVGDYLTGPASLMVMLLCSFLLGAVIADYSINKRKVATFKETMQVLETQSVTIIAPPRVTFEQYMTNRAVATTAEKTFKETMSAVNRLTKTLL